MTALLAPKRKSDDRPPKRGLRQVPIPQRRIGNVGFVIALAAFLALGMVGLLLLNTALQEQGFAVNDRQREATRLGYRVAALESEVTEARSSTRLAVEANKLGMVPNPYPVYLRLPDGSISGDPTALTGRELPDVRYRSPEQLEALAKKQTEAEARRKAELAAEAKERKQRAEEARRQAAEAKAAKEKAQQEKAEQAKQEAAKKKAAAKKKESGR